MDRRDVYRVLRAGEVFARELARLWDDDEAEVGMELAALQEAGDALLDRIAQLAGAGEEE